MSESDAFWSFIFPETYIYYREIFNSFCYIGKKVQKNSYGLKNLVKLGLVGGQDFFFQSPHR